MGLNPMTIVLMRQKGEHTNEPCKDGGRDWRGTGTSQGLPAGSRIQERDRG